MKNISVASVVEQKKARLAQRLTILKDYWPYEAKLSWCINNDYNTASITRNYLKGSVTSIPVAEKIIEAIEKYCKHHHITIAA